MKDILKKLVQTDAALAPLIIRLTLAIAILPHGLQKTFGFFGGYGFSATMGFFATQLGVPAVVTFLVIMAESLGALAIGLGFLTRFCAASLIVVMLGAISMGHWGNGFFMNWTGTQAGEGFEYHLLVIGAALSLIISGSGKHALDSIIAKKTV